MMVMSSAVVARLKVSSNTRCDAGLRALVRRGNEGGIGACAKRAIPRLVKAAQYFENEETDFPKDGSMKKAKLTREQSPKSVS